MRTCARCGSIMGPHDRACGECGQLAAPGGSGLGGSGSGACPACGAALGASERFCGECGAPTSGPTLRPSARGVEPASSAITALPGGAPSARPKTGPASGAAALYVLPREAPAALRRALEARGEVLPVDPQGALTAVQARLGRGPAPGAVCLVGADHDLPMVRLEDPTGRDEELLTDNLFGRRDTPAASTRFTGDLLPEVPVSRIPSLDEALVSRLHEDAAAGLARGWEGGFALSAEVWASASRAVAELLFGARGPALTLSPPAEEDSVGKALRARPGRLYFNVHGTDQEPVWVGESASGGYPQVLGLEAAGVAPRGVVVSEACYGAMIFPDHGAGIGERFLRAGAGSFVGSSIIAWGPPAAPPGLADLIVTGFYAALDAGHDAGAALLEAKRAILEGELDEDESLEPAAHNTLMSFVHYGAPFARVEGAPRVPTATLPAPGGVSAAKSAARGSALDRIRGRMTGSSGSTLGAARDRLRARLPPEQWEALSMGRRSLGELPAEVRSHAEVVRSLTGLLGAEPASVHLFRYRAGAQRYASVSARVSSPGRVAKAATVLFDESGRELRRWVSR